MKLNAPEIGAIEIAHVLRGQRPKPEHRVFGKPGLQPPVLSWISAEKHGDFKQPVARGLDR